MTLFNDILSGNFPCKKTADREIKKLAKKYKNVTFRKVSEKDILQSWKIKSKPEIWDGHYYCQTKQLVIDVRNIYARYKPKYIADSEDCNTIAFEFKYFMLKMKRELGLDLNFAIGQVAGELHWRKNHAANIVFIDGKLMYFDAAGCSFYEIKDTDKILKMFIV